MEKKKIEPEYSAQASRFQPNPKLEESIEYIISEQALDVQPEKLAVVVQGSGKLRHINIYEKYFRKVFFVDTELQLNRELELYGQKTTVKNFIKAYSCRNDWEYEVIRASKFEDSELDADLLFNVNVLDVVPATERKVVISSASQNLKYDGIGIFIVPRNDKSILDRCNEDNKYLDGHIFRHHGTYTFFKNFKNENDLIEKLQENDFGLVRNLSSYRQVCLITQKVNNT